MTQATFSCCLTASCLLRRQKAGLRPSQVSCSCISDHRHGGHSRDPKSKKQASSSIFRKEDTFSSSNNDDILGYTHYGQDKTSSFNKKYGIKKDFTKNGSCLVIAKHKIKLIIDTFEYIFR